MKYQNQRKLLTLFSILMLVVFFIWIFVLIIVDEPVKKQVEDSKVIEVAGVRISFLPSPVLETTQLNVFGLESHIVENRVIELKEEVESVLLSNELESIQPSVFVENYDTYKLFTLPQNSGFKSYMDYRCITSPSSNQYKLQYEYAYTGTYGIRMVDNRFCIAVGSAFRSQIGQCMDLILQNGTIIPCVMADLKADIHTDATNVVTLHNGCVSEFVVTTEELDSYVKLRGDISACTSEWESPVVQIKLYDQRVF